MQDGLIGKDEFDTCWNKWIKKVFSCLRLLPSAIEKFLLNFHQVYLVLKVKKLHNSFESKNC